MLRKFALLVTATAVIAALSGSATAGAAPALTAPAGTLVAAKTSITGTSGSSFTHPLHTLTSVGDVVFSSFMLNAEVTTNTGTQIGLAGQTGSTASGTINGHAAVFSSINLISLKALVAGKGTFELSYVGEIKGTLVCKFTNSGSPGNFTYVAGSDILTIQPSQLFSAACGESEITGELTLETTTGTPIILD